MAVQIVCDGCHALLQPADAKPVGSLDPVVYCAACLAKWAAVDAQIEQERVHAIMMFAGQRTAALILARQQLQKIPDDLGG